MRNVKNVIWLCCEVHMKDVFKNYECDGQLTLMQYVDEQQKLKELQKKFPIPKKYQKEEGWTDDWHYTDLELPEKNDVYYCIHMGFNSDFYNYTYMAWAHGHWWAYAGYGVKWLLVRGERRKWMRPFAWVTVPDLYYRTDDHLQFLRENFVTNDEWEYEERIKRIGGAE